MSRLFLTLKLLLAAFGHALGSILGRAVAFAMMLGLLLSVLVAVFLYHQMDDLPDIAELKQVTLNEPLRIYTRDGQLIGEYGDERRIPVRFEETPQMLRDAILASEDDGFYQHSGVDFKAIARAVISNLQSGDKGQGASTITMQVARNFFLNREKSYDRKVKEALLSFKMERALSKEDIFELYLNKVFLGHRSYGFAAAAQTYYGRDLAELSLPEVAMLAGLPKAPSTFNPLRNPERALKRRNYVLGRMQLLDMIDKASYEVALKAPVTAELHIAELDMQAPYISELARQYMAHHYGDEIYERGFNVTLTVKSDYQESARSALRQGLIDYDLRHGYRGPVAHHDLDTVVLNEDEVSFATQLLSEVPSSGELQPALVMTVGDKSAEIRLRDDQPITLGWDGMKWTGRKGVGRAVKRGDVIYIKPRKRSKKEESDKAPEWVLSQIPKVSGALVTMDPKSGAILSMVGGFDYYLSKFNRATQAERQLGSNIKPFIYAAALEQGLSPASKVSGAPIVVESETEGVWRPQNYEKQFFGPTRLRFALSKSLNLVSIRLLRAVGIEYTRNFLERFGFSKTILPSNLSLALGSASVTPLQVASAYATLANSGKPTRPYLIASITDGEGNYISKEEESCDICSVLEPRTQPFGDVNPMPARALSPESQFLITNMMQQVIRSGTATKAQKLGRSDLSGKTGTTNDYKDAWFSGFNPDVVTSVWLGFDTPAFLGRRESGGGAALPIWIDHMRHVFADYPEHHFPRPANITTAYINKETAERTHRGDPNGYYEYFKIGSEPSATAAVSSQHAPITQQASEELF